MTDDLLYRLLAKVPPTATRAIVIYPTGDTAAQWACQWIGITPEQAAEALYQMADTIVDQRIPPPDWRSRLK